jgi:hypothetical protein
MLSPVPRISEKHLRPVVASALLALMLSAAGGTAAWAGGAKPGGGKPDRTCPTIAFGSSGGVQLSGSAILTGTAADNVGVVKVEIRVDAGTYQLASGTTAWSAVVNTAAYQDGSHTIAARASDAGGNSAVATETVTFKNLDTTPPSVSIALPTPDTRVTGTVTMAGSASDNTGLAKIEVSVDGGTYQPAQGTSNWSYSLDTAAYPDGSHTVAARATDTSGNVASTTETIAVQNKVSSGQPVSAPEMTAGTIGGYAFQDPDRDGIFEVEEQPLGSQNLYLFSSAGTYIGNTTTDSTGWYQFTGLSDGGYLVTYTPSSWWAIRDAWVPDTTGFLTPNINVQLAGVQRADFGWRPIVRSTDPSSPITTYVGANGLTVKSYDDVVPARAVYDRLMTGSLVGQEAQFATIRFDLLSTGTTTTAATALNGVYISFHATSNVSYHSWLDHNGELFHEYGHAWSLYYAYMVQQDPTLAAYLQARGLTGDPRIGTSYAWNPREMIAEDYRELFGDSNAQADDQLNRDVPVAKDVPGLRDYLSGSFMSPTSPTS